MIKILKKSITLLIVLFLSGCAHHSGYYSTYSKNAALGVSVDSYLPYRSYSTYYDHDVYIHQPDRYIYRNYQPYYRKHHKYGRRYDRRARYDQKHQAKYHRNRHHGRNDRAYAYSKRRKGKRNHINRWSGPATRNDNYRRR